MQNGPRTLKTKESYYSTHDDQASVAAVLWTKQGSGCGAEASHTFYPAAQGATEVRASKQVQVALGRTDHTRQNSFRRVKRADCYHRDGVRRPTSTLGFTCLKRAQGWLAPGSGELSSEAAFARHHAPAIVAVDADDGSIQPFVPNNGRCVVPARPYPLAAAAASSFPP